jgi:hypothetical protein
MKNLLNILILFTIIWIFGACGPEFRTRPGSVYCIKNQLEDTIVAYISYTDELDQMKYNDSIVCLEYVYDYYLYTALIVEHNKIKIWPKQKSVCLAYNHNPGYCTNSSGRDYSYLPMSLCPTKIIDSIVITNTCCDTLLCIDNTDCDSWTHDVIERGDDYWYPNGFYIDYTFKYPTKE